MNLRGYSSEVVRNNAATLQNLAVFNFHRGAPRMATTHVNMREVKSRLSELGKLAHEGERIIVTKAGRPYLDLLAHCESRGKRSPGRLAGQIRLAPDFDKASPDLLAEFEGDA